MKDRYYESFDSFITHRRQKADLEKAQRSGIDAYNYEQKEKIKILDYLLTNYNDGRRKNFFCVTVNLLELSDLQEAVSQMKEKEGLLLLPVKERAVYVVDIFQKIADKRNITLKLNKKKRQWQVFCIWR